VEVAVREWLSMQGPVSTATEFFKKSYQNGQNLQRVDK
jgi:hypothetical protein